MDSNFITDLIYLHELGPAFAALAWAAIYALACSIAPIYTRFRWNSFPLLPAAPETPLPDHVVLIPARNEAASITHCLASFPHSLCVVIDDASTDQTADLARQAGAEVRPAQALVAPWLGKSNACWTGAQLTESDWIAFVDADCAFSPTLLPSAFQYAIDHQLQALSLLPDAHPTTFFERLLLPLASAFNFYGLNPAHLENPKLPASYADGRFLLIRRSAYTFIGGHRNVKAYLTENLALAELLKRHRMAHAVLRPGDLATLSRADLAAELVRNTSSYLWHRPWNSTLAAVSALMMASWLPLLLLHATLAWWLPLFLLVLIALPALAWKRWYGGYFRALGFPLGAWLFLILGFAGVAARLAPRRVIWKGRRV